MEPSADRIKNIGLIAPHTLLLRWLIVVFESDALLRLCMSRR
jgi:hypothetical protein